MFQWCLLLWLQKRGVQLDKQQVELRLHLLLWGVSNGANLDNRRMYNAYKLPCFFR